MSENKPWEQIPAKIWHWLVKGWKRYITIPIFILLFIIPIIFHDSYKKCYSFFHDLFENKKSFPTKDEADVFNEWVVLISTFNDKIEAEKQLKKFKEVYKSSIHEVWKDDIFFVRNAKQENQWQIVIDAYPGSSSKEDVQGSIDNMWAYCRTRELENTLGHWLNGATPIFYDSLKFVKTYGHIENPD
jgi:hypothetical protein